MVGNAYENEKDLAARIARSDAFGGWQVVVLHDDIEFARSADKLLWATWIRFNPSTDIHAREVTLKNNHIGYEPPIIIDARM